MKRDAIAWVIDYGNGNLARDTIRPTKREAIAVFCDGPTGAPAGWYSWTYWYRKGCRAIKVRLVPIAGGGEA